MIDKIIESLYPGVVTEYRFHPERRWRFDYAWPDKKIALEQEGGVWIRGGHTTGKGIERDIEKYNEAIRLGWYVVRATPRMIQRGDIFSLLDYLLSQPNRS